MARLDWVDRQRPALPHQRLKAVFEGIEPPVDRRGGKLGLGLLLDERINVTPGHLPQLLGKWREKAPQIPAIILDGMRRIVARAQMQTEVVDGNWFHAELPRTACCGTMYAMAYS
jgi:hypothetical protein